jgi:RNA 2',3'-cyclic 3'-phosphodiesterase
VSERLFFALWPDDLVRGQISAMFPAGALAEAGVKPQRPDQWHVTLVFLGSVPLDRKEAVLRSAGRVRCAPFSIRFDRIEFWRRARVVCMTASKMPRPLGRLVDDLRAALADEGFIMEDREFHPHVTLARKVTAWPQSRLPEPLTWPAHRFALVRSVSGPGGSRYEPSHWWNLGIDTD